MPSKIQKNQTKNLTEHQEAKGYLWNKTTNKPLLWMRKQTRQMSEGKRSEAAPTIDLFDGWEFTHNPRINK